MAQTGADLLLAYPVVDRLRAEAVAALARASTLRVAIDSEYAAKELSAAAQSANTTLGILADIDVGLHRTGVQSPPAGEALAKQIATLPGLRFDGLFYYPGHLSGPTGNADQRSKSFAAI